MDEQESLRRSREYMDEVQREANADFEGDYVATYDGRLVPRDVYEDLMDRADAARARG